MTDADRVAVLETVLRGTRRVEDDPDFLRSFEIDPALPTPDGGTVPAIVCSDHGDPADPYPLDLVVVATDHGGWSLVHAPTPLTNDLTRGTSLDGWDYVEGAGWDEVMRFGPDEADAATGTLVYCVSVGQVLVGDEERVVGPAYRRDAHEGTGVWILTHPRWSVVLDVVSETFGADGATVGHEPYRRWDEGVRVAKAYGTGVHEGVWRLAPVGHAVRIERGDTTLEVEPTRDGVRSGITRLARGGT